MTDERRENDGVSEQHKEATQIATIDADAKRTAGQRTINAIWEVTQATIAIAVTLDTLYVAAQLALVISGGKADSAFLLLSNAFFLVIGFYFGRTNHTRMGGVGANEVGR